MESHDPVHSNVREWRVRMEIPPGLWITCRVVACETRLRLLWELFEHRELSVNEARFLIGVSQPCASTQLKTLSRCGLIIFRREDMRVIYRAEANSAIRFAPEVLDALRICFERSVSFDAVIRQATAFTHERRIEIVRALNGTPLSFIKLLATTGMSSTALSRHLDKLERRGVVKRAEGLYFIGSSENEPGCTLLRLVCA